MEQAEVLIAGAGPAGLSLAACLKKAGVSCLVIDQREKPGGPWRDHYDRLHLHTPASFSTLPYFAFPRGTPVYPSRDQFVSYLESYCRHFGIRPVLNTKILSGERVKNSWTLSTTNGSFSGRFLVLATGKSQRPRSFSVPGLEGFAGVFIHSSDYRSGVSFNGKKVLVVGFGNSACEIAMDLFEQGASPVISVRSAVNVVPRELLGIPILYWSRILSAFPPRIADGLTAPLIRLANGNMGKAGLEKASYGSFVQIRDRNQVPVIDIGTLRYIREGKIRVATDPVSVNGNRVRFSNEMEEDFDAIIAATGYDFSWPELAGLPSERLEDLRRHSERQAFFGHDDLYSCGFTVSGTGMLRAIATEAKYIAAGIGRKRNK